MMGALADAALAAGGEVIGVIPRHLVDREVAHGGLTELRVVETLHERKAEMAALSDGFIALPGGLGTLEELAEVSSWAQLGLHDKPIGLLGPRRATGTRCSPGSTTPWTRASSRRRTARSCGSIRHPLLRHCLSHPEAVFALFKKRAQRRQIISAGLQRDRVNIVPPERARKLRFESSDEICKNSSRLAIGRIDLNLFARLGVLQRDYADVWQRSFAFVLDLNCYKIVPPPAHPRAPARNPALENPR